MAVGCGAKFAKIMVIIFNVIFLCSGLVLMALGIWLLVTLAQSYGPSQVFELASGSYLYRNSAILLIAMGCFILFVTIFGIIAAARESAIMLSIFAVLMFIIFAGEIAGGVVAIVYKDRILATVEETLEKSISNDTYYEVNQFPGHCSSTGIGALWDWVQIWLDCCGVEGDNRGFKKLEKCSFPNASNFYVPEHYPLTCCARNKDFDKVFHPSNQEDYVPSVYNCSSIDTDIYTTPSCTASIERWVVRFAPVLIGIGIGFGMLEMFGFIFVICLCMNTDKGFKRF